MNIDYPDDPNHPDPANEWRNIIASILAVLFIMLIVVPILVGVVGTWPK